MGSYANINLVWSECRFFLLELLCCAVVYGTFLLGGQVYGIKEVRRTHVLSEYVLVGGLGSTNSMSHTKPDHETSKKPSNGRHACTEGSNTAADQDLEVILVHFPATAHPQRLDQLYVWQLCKDRLATHSNSV